MQSTAMKPSLTLDFLRGILFAFVTHECYTLIVVLVAILPLPAQLPGAGAAGLLLVVHLVLLLGLLFRPHSSAKAVFVFLALFCLLPVGWAFYWLGYPLRALPRSPFTVSWIMSVLTSFAVAGIAYFHYRGHVQAQMPKKA
jgi:hypothetical protein